MMGERRRYTIRVIEPDGRRTTRWHVRATTRMAERLLAQLVARRVGRAGVIEGR